MWTWKDLLSLINHYKEKKSTDESRKKKKHPITLHVKSTGDPLAKFFQHLLKPSVKEKQKMVKTRIFYMQGS